MDLKFPPTVTVELKKVKLPSGLELTTSKVLKIPKKNLLVAGA